MIELPDDELDKLFRKSSEELDPTYEPEDWNALSKRLDQEDGRTPAGWLRKWWPVVMLALFIPAGLGAYYFLNDNSKANKNIVARSSKPEVVKSESVISDKSTVSEADKEIRNEEKLAEADRITSDNKKNIVADRKIIEIENNGNEKSDKTKRVLSPDYKESIAKKTDVNKAASSKILPRSRSKTGGVYLEPNRLRGKEGDGAFSSNQNKLTARKSIKKKNVDKDQFETKDQEENKIGNVKKPGNQINNLDANVPDVTGLTQGENLNIAKVKEESRFSLSVNALDHLPFNRIKSLKLPTIEVKETEVAVTSEPAAKPELSPKMAIRFGYSPDLSTVGVKNFSKPGSAVSLMIEYALSRKLYLQVGVVRSVKVYNAKAGEYEWPADWKPQKVYPTSVDGTCKIFEIPLNFRYDITQNDRSRWFVGTGVSSYYMGNEKYIYNYPEHTYGDIWRDHETKTGWYWLSHVNVSAGYEYRISKKLSLLAEPYVKIPIKKVGYGKVDLFTAGMWLSVRYTPVFK